MKLLIHSQTWTVQPLKFGNFFQHIYGCNYLSILWIKLIHVSKMGPRRQCKSKHWKQELSKIAITLVVWAEPHSRPTGMGTTHDTKQWEFKEITNFDMTDHIKIITEQRKLLSKSWKAKVIPWHRNVHHCSQHCACWWSNTVRSTESRDHFVNASSHSPNRPISKKLGLKTILLISFRST